MERQMIRIIDCRTIEYSRAWDTQLQYFDALLSHKTKHPIAQHSTESATHHAPEQEVRQDDIRQLQDGRLSGVMLYCEHPHVYTLGKSGSANNMLVNDAFLHSIGATYFKTDRGGDITYHGYGQLVGYPILDIERLGLSLKEYIDRLEEVVIRTIARWGIEGARMEGATGVWIDGRRKICAIGVKASRYVTMHGFALNVNTDLKYFSYINPCGFVDKGVTSLAAETGHAVEMEQVKEALTEEFKKIMGMSVADAR